MLNGTGLSTGNHPVEALLPMLHLKQAGFELKVATPSVAPVVFETWVTSTGDRRSWGSMTS